MRLTRLKRRFARPALLLGVVLAGVTLTATPASADISDIGVGPDGTVVCKGSCTTTISGGRVTICLEDILCVVSESDGPPMITKPDERDL